MKAIDAHAHLRKNAKGFDKIAESGAFEEIWLMDLSGVRRVCKPKGNPPGFKRLQRQGQGFRIPRPGRRRRPARQARRCRLCGAETLQAALSVFGRKVLPDIRARAGAQNARSLPHGARSERAGVGRERRRALIRAGKHAAAVPCRRRRGLPRLEDNAGAPRLAAPRTDRAEPVLL